ncbi:MAG: hypothetical protein A2219_04245 [Elusimicrobia bacterium RIFOXYA2_FULL_50_26]|nr:MAG: hypothetical protein A2219_04245 [Elusimicrobia bacterium RIFOXYA2_FULL_50_26]
MSYSIKHFESQLLKLPLNKRAKLAEQLIKSLDKVDETENEHLWVKEAEKRYSEYKKGNMPFRSMKESMQYARKMIR